MPWFIDEKKTVLSYSFIYLFSGKQYIQRNHTEKITLQRPIYYLLRIIANSENDPILPDKKEHDNNKSS